MNSFQRSATRKSLATAFDSNVSSNSSSQTDGLPSSKRSRTAWCAPVHPRLPQQRCLASDQIADKISVIQVMIVKESTTYKPHHYLEHTSVVADDRSHLCQWGFDMMDACKVNRNVATIAIGYFDRFLSRRGSRVVEACLANQREFQLAFITCLVIALKGREGMEVTPTFVALTMCQDMYHPEEIIAMEIEILRTLSWFLNGPTCEDFIAHFVDLLPAESDSEIVSNLYQAAIEKTQTSLLDYSLALKTPSSVALTSIASVIRDMDLQQKNALKASAFMSHIGFVMGAAMGGMN